MNKTGGGGDRSGLGRWIVLLAIGLLAFQLLARTSSSSRDVPYSQFKELAREGSIDRVRIKEDELLVWPNREIEGTPAVPWRVQRVEDDQLISVLESNNVIYEGVADSGWITNILFFWILPFMIVILVMRHFLQKMAGGVGGGGGGGGGKGGMMSIGKSRAKLYVEQGVGISFNDVAGADEAVEELYEIVEFLKTPEKFRKLGGRIPKGVLLVGPPGTGKTLLAKAVAGEAGVPFLSLSGSDFVEMFVGVGAARVRDLFQQASSMAPAIIFIDELDAVGRTRSGAHSLGTNEEREQTLNQLLAEMDGFDGKQGLIIMAATNRPEVLDAALLRPGRFDRQVLVDRPDLRGREKILMIHVRDLTLDPDVELIKIAAVTPGLAGAELANICNEAALLAAREGRDTIHLSHFISAVERVMAGLEKKNRRMNDTEKNIVAHHEAGHALVAAILPSADRVHKVSIIPRGLGALGYTLQLPLEDRYLLTEDELMDKITVLLGGRVAEEVFFNNMSTGASDDLKRASDLARRMVTEWGMSSALGPLTFSREDGPSFLGIDTGAPHYSNRTSETIDNAVVDLVMAAHSRATEIIVHNREHLKKLALALLEREVIEGNQLMEILKDIKLPGSKE